MGKSKRHGLDLLVFKRIHPQEKTRLQFSVFLLVKDNIPKFQSERIQPQAKTLNPKP